MTACSVGQVGDREWWCATHQRNAETCDQQSASVPVDDDEHFPWHYLAQGVVCACGLPMTDEVCPATKFRDFAKGVLTFRDVERDTATLGDSNA